MLANKEIVELVPSWFRHDGSCSGAVISTRLRLARNIGGHKFPATASLMERKSVFNEVVAASNVRLADKHFTAVNLATCDPINQSLLLEKKVITRELVEGQGDRGVVFDDECRSSFLINEEDHIRLQCIDAGLRISELWESVVAIEDLLSQELRFAFDVHRGFLTAYASNCGCGLQVSFLLHLPGLVLTRSLEQVLTGATQMGFSVKSFLGEQSEVVGNLFQVSNRASVGVVESDFLMNSQKLIMKIVELEAAARERLLTEAYHEIIDKIFRSVGILKYTHSLSLAEMLNLSSALRFGIESKIITVLEIPLLNKMILYALPAHMELQRKQKMSDQEKNFLRADIVRQFLAAVEVP
ncbi:MAG: hypothetical protein JW795_05635 [Chitinivibrionales bacterium]|nr:hypothetical protein [Chitinivibrionales bacterium]